MFNNFKATIRKLSELSHPDLRNLFSWSSNSAIQASNPNLLIAKASNSSGEVVVYVSAEPILLVDSYVVNPQSSDDLQKAGDAIDSALAQRAGVARIWVVVPDGVEEHIKGERFLRVVERKVCQPVTTKQPLGCSNSRSFVEFLN